MTSSLTVELSVGTELWAIWGGIAVQQLEQARTGRERIATAIATGKPHDQNEELYPSMISIAATAISIDGFATLVQSAGVTPRKPSIPKPSRGHWIWEILFAGFPVGQKKKWRRDLADLWVMRSDRTTGGLVHPQTVFAIPAQEHPLVPNVSWARALFRVEAAERAVDLMRDIYGACKVKVRPGLNDLELRINGVRGLLDELS